ncbi:MAG: GTP 3',8-cyclase MoaA [Bacteroidota bacterium]
MLHDNHGRKINYLRLAVTDRCNLRCFYCMPEKGIQYVARKELLSYEEMERLLQLMIGMGIEKIRITGGEPFLRKGMLDFMRRLRQISGLRQLNITTNGTLTANMMVQLKGVVNSVNLSLDSLDAERFYAITRRDVFPEVMRTLEQLIAYNIPTKINMVVMEGQNIADMIPMVELTRNYPISVRFIEEMPFNGSGSKYSNLLWDYQKIIHYIKQHYPNLRKIPDPTSSTAFHYKIPNFRGTIGVIAAYSRLFCHTCNRIRLTPQGLLKTCLYDDGIFNIKDLIRAGANNEQIKMALLEALGNKAKDGFEAEKNRRFRKPISESMASIGG